MIKTFLAAVAALFLVSACAETPPPPPPQPTAPAVRNFLVFFDFDRSTLTPRAAAIVKEAANVAKAGNNARVTCTGHTDTAGPANYNLALSLRRANTVKDALVREGVPAGQIAVVGRGEESLLVQTRDGVREPQNRRVEIVIQ
jgi:OOP family OmpA-OmpF porin